MGENSSNKAFESFAAHLPQQNELRQQITDHYHVAEPATVQNLIDKAEFPQESEEKIFSLSKRLVENLKTAKRQGKEALIQDLLQEYSLSSEEGIALMCLAEALLRIPDKATRDLLIKDKIQSGNWKAHLKGHNKSKFVNFATWGLAITGKMVANPGEKVISNAITRVLMVGGTPVIRKGMDIAMQMMGEQFVTGETIDEALKNVKPMIEKGFLYSYDMLGEAALTKKDAQDYVASYKDAIAAIGKDAQGKGVYRSSGISIKLSAIHPRYYRAQHDRVIGELYPQLLELMQLAKQYDIGVNIDAEETERLELSLDLLEKLCFEPSLKGWDGIGFVIQAYQKRCYYVIDYLVDLAERSGHRLMVRLVKGAYWDSEIKLAQIEGLNDYPVFTRKNHTDISYVACARKLMKHKNLIYPQFASHNARTLASVYEIAGEEYEEGAYEFQCLHGMGEPLYEQVVGKKEDGKLGVPCRVYAPVGTHETLLAYLVRRLLENGANTSFVNLIADPNISIDELLIDPVVVAREEAKENGIIGELHEKISLPVDLFMPQRKNSMGIDLSDENALKSLANDLLASNKKPFEIYPRLNKVRKNNADSVVVTNPASLKEIIGNVRYTTADEAKEAVAIAKKAQPEWQNLSFQQRASILERAADLLEERMHEFMAVAIREAGKSFANAIAEVKEAVDFLRFYSWQAKNFFNEETHEPLGTVVCISPWNFPLAIFTGQVSAALVTGNTVLAKPAEQTSIIASLMVDLLIESGVPAGVLQYLPGDGASLGEVLIEDNDVNGVMFTGSTEVAKILARSTSERLNSDGTPVPLIAETGGQNAMIVDSSALTEQVVTDVMNSAFDSAGQRCSALRILCVQEEAADRLIEMLQGAMQEFRIGNPEFLETDMGPVIDLEARNNIDQHIQKMKKAEKAVHQLAYVKDIDFGSGYFMLPTLIEIDDISELKREVFGPVLHVLRYKRENLDQLIQSINGSGYGLTFGVHTRIDETVDKLSHQIDAGNIYANRNIVGAVVGVQPFGGEGLSGTGPKAGGPLYLYRLLSKFSEESLQNTLEALDGRGYKESQEDVKNNEKYESFKQWLEKEDISIDADKMTQLQHAYDLTLRGPTGEKNIYRISNRNTVLCIASERRALLLQMAMVCYFHGKVAVEKNTITDQLITQLPGDVRNIITQYNDIYDDKTEFDTVIFTGSQDELIEASKQLAQRKGAIHRISVFDSEKSAYPVLGMLKETSVSINTAAAGGNANLMMIG